MSNVELSANQRSVLELAVATDGRIQNYPAGLLGGARTSVVRGLLRNGLVEPHDAGYRLTTDGYAAIGAEAATVAAVAAPESEMEADGTNEDEAPTEGIAPEIDPAPPAPEPSTAPAPPEKRKRAERGDTKSAKVLGLLVRPEGVTIVQIMAETNWQEHSVRGFLAGTVKKKGYTVTNSKEGDGERVYRILSEEERDASAGATASGDEEE